MIDEEEIAFPAAAPWDAVTHGAPFVDRIGRFIRDLGPTEWKKQALCRGMDPNLFFPHESEKPAPEILEMCTSCPVREECLSYGLHESHGWFGGYGPKARRRIARQRRLARRQSVAS